MAESGDDEADHHHGRLALAQQPPPPAATHNHLFGGSFQFIVQEQAKSMVAIQELQQEVGSLLLFRQAVLAALPHLSAVAAVSPTGSSSGVVVGKDLVVGSGSPVVVGSVQTVPSSSATTPLAVQTSWARRKHAAAAAAAAAAGYPLTSLSADEGVGSKAQQQAQKATGLSSHHQHQHHQMGGVADSGFSTEASGGSSNSNTSPRSSRFDGGSQDSSAGSSSHNNLPPMEKELLQHLERVQQRLARLRKDEDRLLTLLNPARIRSPHHQQPAMIPGTSSSSAHHGPAGLVVDEDADELWHLLEEIESRSRALQEQHNPTTTVKADELPEQMMMGKPVVDHGGGYRLDRKTVSAVLKLSNPVQLQRHLLRALLDNQVVKDELAGAKEEVARWRSSSRQTAQQMAALKDENDDLRFQLEEQKIELEGTKARLRVVNSRTNSSTNQAHQPSAGINVTSVRMRTAGTQTNDTPSNRRPSSTQTDPLEDQRRPLPCRVVDASPKPRKLSDQLVNNSWATTTSSAPEEDYNSAERPNSSVERRSYSSRIPTPIKPAKMVSSSTSSISPSIPSSAKGIGTLDSSSPTGKRELPDIPNPSPRDRVVKRTPEVSSTRSSPRPFQQQHQQPKQVRLTVLSASAARLRARLGLTDSLSSTEDTSHTPDSNVKGGGGLIHLQTTDVVKGMTAEDYYDSINNHHHHHHLHHIHQQNNSLKRSKSRSTNGSSSVSGPYSPLDSLERSLPSVGINYHYQRTSSGGSGNLASNASSTTLKRSSYYATTSGSSGAGSADNSSTTPSNSLGIGGPP